MGAEIFQKAIYKSISAKQKNVKTTKQKKSLLLRVNSNTTRKPSEDIFIVSEEEDT